MRPSLSRSPYARPRCHHFERLPAQGGGQQGGKAAENEGHPGYVVLFEMAGDIIQAEALIAGEGRDGLETGLEEQAVQGLLREVVDVLGLKLHPRSEEHTSELQSLRHL